MSETKSIEHVAIVGAGIGGLMSALALNRHGIEASLFERDPAPKDNIEPENSGDWLRKGVPQSLHPHFFMGRLRVLLEENYPKLVAQLFAAGADESRLQDYVYPALAHRISANQGDSQLSTINCRRTTFEMTVRRYVESLSGITIHNQAKIVGLETAPGNPIEVTGVRIDTGGEIRRLDADAVIDTSGRFSKLIQSLKDAGAAIQEEQRNSGIWYFTRHYRIKPGQSFPDVFGLPGAQFEDFTVGALPADNRYFTVTFQVYRKDKELAAALRNPNHFHSVCEATNQVAPWVDPARAEPTSNVYGFGQMDSFWRKTVVNDQPTVLNYFCVGDACLRSNPKYGRGCTWSTLAAHILSDLLAADATPSERVSRYEKALEDTFRQDWQTMREIDRSAERAFEVAMGKRAPSLSERVSQRIQYFVNEAMLLEPALFRDLWRGYNGFQNMDKWARNPRNWARLIRAWFQRQTHRSLLDSQRGRISHQAMSTIDGPTT